MCVLMSAMKNVASSFIIASLIERALPQHSTSLLGRLEEKYFTLIAPEDVSKEMAISVLDKTDQTPSLQHVSPLLTVTII